MSISALKTRIDAAMTAAGVDRYGFIWDTRKMDELSNVQMPWIGVLLESARTDDVATRREVYTVSLLSLNVLPPAERVEAADHRADFWMGKMDTANELANDIIDAIPDRDAFITGAVERSFIPYSTAQDFYAVQVTFRVELDSNLCAR